MFLTGKIDYINVKTLKIKNMSESLNTGDFIFEVTENPDYDYDFDLPSNEDSCIWPAFSLYDLMVYLFTPKNQLTESNNIVIGQSFFVSDYTNRYRELMDNDMN